MASPVAILRRWEEENTSDGGHYSDWNTSRGEERHPAFPAPRAAADLYLSLNVKLDNE